MSEGVKQIMRERHRQQEAEGYDASHDDHHRRGELALAAICYAAPVAVYIRRNAANGVTFNDPWPWSNNCDKRPRWGNEILSPDIANLSMKDRIRQLIKAGALIAAEIDRLLRSKRNRYKGDM